MKTGQLSTLVNFVIAVSLVIASLFFASKLYGSFVNSETRSVSYENFEILSSKLNDIIDSEEEVVTDSLVYEIHPGYFLAAYDYNSDYMEHCLEPRSTPISLKAKPSRCEEDQACICLYGDTPLDKGEFEGEDPNVIECTNLGKTRIYTRLTEDYENFENANLGCEKKEYPLFSSIKQDYEYETLYLSPSLGEWGTQPVYIERMKGPADVNYLYITKSTPETIERSRLIHKCPDTDGTYPECVGLPYNSVFEEEVDAEGNTESFVCRYDEEYDVCYIEEIEDCRVGKIRGECNCNGMAFDFGYCLGDEFVAREYGKEYCLSSEISECDDYQEFSDCAFDVCGVGDCIPEYDNDVFNDCSECPTKHDRSSCQDYKTMVLKKIDACDLDGDGKTGFQEEICYPCEALGVESCDDYNEGFRLDVVPDEDNLEACRLDACGAAENSVKCVVQDNKCTGVIE